MRRHSLGLLAGLGLAPLVWIAVTWGMTTAIGHLRAEQFDRPLLLSSVAVLMAVGLVCGVLAGSRISPLAALLPGGVLLGLSVWPLLDSPAVATMLPSWADTTPLRPGGVALAGQAMLGTLLFVSALMPNRWHRASPAAAAPAPGDVTTPPTTPPPRSDEPGPQDRPAGDPERTTIPMRRDPRPARPPDH
ncbi:hypothetical protein RIF23_08885 [Lipingzhangella sp. LS1_29]|uniref:Uncharacterized protein n=1 Tax=Lipingzhangella rawalii TaxID=2055835 RepID=A0ABU2H540_9ACTN|nr:hypothetical protein [Lipingzhangella rawalii]MDS1270408.1 hypothetical protein [Lipingzhangella rawalii]